MRWCAMPTNAPTPTWRTHDWCLECVATIHKDQTHESLHGVLSHTGELRHEDMFDAHHSCSLEHGRRCYVRQAVCQDWVAEIRRSNLTTAQRAAFEAWVRG